MPAVVHPMPKTHEVTELFSQLLGKAVTAARMPQPSSLKGGLLAVFRHDDRSLAAVFHGDLQFAATAGASLAMLPPAAVEGAVASGKLTTQLVDAYREVMNIASRLLNDDHGRHVVLTALGTKATKPDVAKALANPSARVDLKLTVAGHPPGSLTLLLA